MLPVNEIHAKNMNCKISIPMQRIQHLLFPIVLQFVTITCFAQFEDRFEDYDNSEPAHFDLRSDKKLYSKRTGKVVVDFSQWDQSHIVHDDDGSALVLYKSTYIGNSQAGGFKVTAGYVIFHDKETEVFTQQYEVQDYKMVGRLIFVRSDNYWQLLNSKGVDYENKYEDIGHDFYEGLLAVKQNGKWGYIARQGYIGVVQKISPAYHSATPFYNGAALVSSQTANGTCYGIIDKEGRIVTPMQYKCNEYDLAKGNLVLYQEGKAGKYGVLKASGQTLIPFLYDFIERKDAGDNSVFLCRMNKLWGVINEKGATIIPFNYDSIEGEEIFGIVYVFGCYKKNKPVWLDTNGQPAESPH